MNKNYFINELKASIEVLRDLVESVPEERIYFKKSQEIWSVQEHINHLALVQTALLKRIENAIESKNPKVIPYIPDYNKEKKLNTKTVNELLITIEEYRKRQIELINNANETRLDKKIDHPEYIKYDFKILLRHIIIHDYFHMYRIEELAFLKVKNIVPL